MRRLTTGKILLWVALPAFVLVYVVFGVVVAAQRANRPANEEKHKVASTVPEVVLTRPPLPARPIDLADPPADDIVEDGTVWPRACTLLDDNEIRLALPQATGFTRTGITDTLTFETKTRTYDNGMPVVGGTYTSKVVKVAVPEQSCRIDLDLPHKDWLGEATHMATLYVRVEGFGGQESLKGYFTGGYADRTDADEAYAHKHLGWLCAGLAPTTRPEGLICTKGTLTLSFRAQLLGLEGEKEQLRMAGQPEKSGHAAKDFAAAVEPAIMGYLLDKIPA